MLDKVKKNVPQVAMEQYFWVLSGEPKVGKTTFFDEVVKEHFQDPDKGLLVAFEKGYGALEVNVVDINDWTEWEDLVDELIDNRDEITYRFLGLDTVDKMEDMATEQVIKEWNMKNPSKRTNDIGGVGAKGNSDQGFGVGYKYVEQKLGRSLDKLSKAGFGFMAITHSKDRTVKQKDGSEFDQLQLSLSSTARKVFVNSADFIVFITNEKKKDRQGNVTATRYMNWRTDGYIEAGSRFPDVPERIEYDVHEFLNVFEHAVNSKLKGKDVSKLGAEQKAENEKKASEFISNIKKEKVSNAENNLDALKAAIREITDKMDKAQKKELAKKFKEEFDGAIDFNTFEDVDQLKTALEIAKAV